MHATQETDCSLSHLTHCTYSLIGDHLSLMHVHQHQRATGDGEAFSLHFQGTSLEADQTQYPSRQVAKFFTISVMTES